MKYQNQGGKKAGIAGQKPGVPIGPLLGAYAYWLCHGDSIHPVQQMRHQMASRHFLVGNDPRFLRGYKMDRVEDS